MRGLSHGGESGVSGGGTASPADCSDIAAVGPFENSRMGEVVRPKRAGEAARPTLHEGLKPPDFVLGRRGAGRFISGVVSGAVVSRYTRRLERRAMDGVALTPSATMPSYQREKVVARSSKILFSSTTVVYSLIGNSPPLASVLFCDSLGIGWTSAK